MVNCCLFRCQRIDGVSPYVCSDYFLFGLGCLVATFGEKAALTLDDMFSLYFDYLYIFYLPFWFRRLDLGSDCFSS